MVDVQLRGFPRWTVAEDLKFTIDEIGYPSSGMRIRRDETNPDASTADARLPTWDAADAIVERLHKFEFTPGYPLQARIKPGQQRPEASDSWYGKAAGKGAAGKGAKPAGDEPYSNPLAIVEETPAMPSSDPNFGFGNCIGAGRIEGWFLHTKSNVLKNGWGHVQSYCFEGNLVFRPVNSTLLKDVEFVQTSPCTFEVMMVRGQCEAVRITTPELEGMDFASTAIVPPDAGYNAYGEADPGQEGEEAPLASVKSQKRREREEADGRCVFIGGFGREITEDTLWKFAEQAGTVAKVKIFYNIQTWVSKGCGKISYAELDSAERAVNEISGTVLNERIVTIEPLGQSSNQNPNPGRKQQRPGPARRDDGTDDLPKQLPLSLFTPQDSAKQKLDICFAAFEDLMNHHNPETSVAYKGVSLILMIRKLVMEVNDIFEGDETTLQAWCHHLRGFQWFRDNQQAVKWQASKKRVNISKTTESAPIHISRQLNLRAQVEQRKAEQQIMGKSLFEATEEEKSQVPKAPPNIQANWGKGGWDVQQHAGAERPSPWAQH